MCSVTAIADFNRPQNSDCCEIGRMGMSMKHRGPDDSGIFCDTHVSLQHNRLAVMDPHNGKQPMRVQAGGRFYTIIYNGEIYNTDELRREIELSGHILTTKCDTEVVLYSYILYGTKCPVHLNGIFAFIIYDEDAEKLFIARDRFGVKPFFYTFCGSALLCASELKALLSHPAVHPEIGREGLWQLLFMSPVTPNGSGIFRGISELLPAQCGVFDRGGLKLWKYWHLEAKEFSGDAVEAAECVRELVVDAARRQLVSDVPLCTFLSGGLDSSAISAIAARYYAEKGEVLSTYSFEYEGNKKEFTKTLFQPNGDDEYAAWLAGQLGTNHTVLTASSESVAGHLRNAVAARDFPGQADIDSSLLYFCSQIKKNHTVALSGECADEIFGGYPWFYRPEMLHRDFFPWIHDPMLRPSLFREDFADPKNGYDYACSIYKSIVSDVSVLVGECDEDRNARIATVLSVDCFMASLLERKDRMSMYSALEVRVPFADHRILEYVYNVPWSIKFEGGVEKALLRNAMRDYLPERILTRKKSPYPKTHVKEYERIVTATLNRRIESGSSIASLLDQKAYRAMLTGESDTWFGQLMSKPQLIAWLLQFDYWLEDYKVAFKL